EVFNNYEDEDDKDEDSQQEEKFNLLDEFEQAGEFNYYFGIEFDNKEGKVVEPGSDDPYEKENDDWGTNQVQVIEYGEICDTGEMIFYSQFVGIKLADETTFLLDLIEGIDCEIDN
ncbi:MAG: hypothetical protein EZS28_052646, partial [Streblomastix strix]